MSKRLSLDEMLTNVKRRLAIKQWNISFEPNDWFFPSDVSSHNSLFKYQCKKLHEAGLLERQGYSDSRWGYSYRIKQKDSK
jgi:hypothetical protein